MTGPDSIQVLSAPGWLRSAQVADILNVSPKTVQRYARNGLLPFQLTLGKHRRYPEEAIRELAASLRFNPGGGSGG